VTYDFYFSGFRNAEEDPDNKKLIYYFDNKGRAIGSENELGHSSSRNYDGQDHLVQTTDPQGHTSEFTYDANHNLVSSVNPLNKQIINSYDAQQQLINVTDPLGHAAVFTYDGEHHPTSTTVTPAPGQSIVTRATYYPNGFTATTRDGRGVATTMTYDSHGNPATSRVNGEIAVTTQYDAAGRLVTLTDQGNTTTRFQYTNSGLVTRKTDPFGRITEYGYNGDGALHSRADRNGDTTIYTYTPTGKVDTVTYQGGSSVHFSYDQNDRLKSMTDPLGTTTYTRDAAGRVLSTTDANGNTIGYTYDENGYTGLLTTLTCPGNNQVHYAYDKLNRLKTVTNWLGQTATYNYDDAGRLTSLTNFNGSVTTYTHDNANRLTGLAATTSGNAVIAAFAYTLDANGNRTGIDKQTPLSPALPTRTETASYLKNRLTGTGSTLYTHDNEGQLQTKQEGSTTTYSFDKAYRLTGISDGTSYQYDGSGNRLRAVRNNVATRYIYDAVGNLLAEADGSNAITRYYIHGLGLLAAVTPANATFCYHYDGVGSTVAITDGSQNVVNAYAYTPDGMILGENEAFAQPFKYVGKLGVMAEANGLYYMRARYYNPAVGRFISEDPLGFGGGDVNLYVYAGNNPVVRVDPSGLFDISASARQGIDWFGGELMLGNFQKLSAVAAVATIESGPPSLVFGGMAVVAGGLKTSLYSQHPYRDTVQSAVTMPLGSSNPGADLILDEFINQTNAFNDQCHH
jgi:RHS repeat-associated protein